MSQQPRDLVEGNRNFEQGPGASGPAEENSHRSSISSTQNNSSSNSDHAGPTAKEKPDMEQARAPTDKDPFEVSWDGGDNDPLCPRSFSKARKWLITIIVASASFCVTNASSIYTATYAQMEEEFHSSRIVSILGLTTYVCGIALGPMLLGPLSEFYGRRPIYLISWGFFVIWNIPQAVAPGMATILVTRFLDGFSGSAFLAVSGGTVGDLFPKESLQAPMALFSIAPFIGPSVGPLLGGFINYFTHWRWTFWVMLIWSSVLWLSIIFLVPETFHPILLKKKAQKLRKETGDERWLAPTEKVSKSVAKAVTLSLLRPFELLMFEYMCLLLDVYSAFLLGILYLFFGAFPLVFRETHGFNLWQVGLSFAGIGVGMILAIATDSVWYRIRLGLMAKLSRETGVEGASEPEFRLPPVIFGALLAPIGIFMFGWSTYPWVHWIVPIIGSAIFGAGVILVFTGIFTFLVDAYPTYAASALAANAFVRCAFAASFPLFGNQMYEKLGYQWASSLLGFVSIAMMPFPYIFFKYGKKIRARSRFAKN